MRCGAIEHGVGVFGVAAFCLGVAITWPMTGTAVAAPDAASDGTTTLSLAGGWHFAADPQDAGIRDQWAAGTPTQIINLPGTTDEAGIGDLQSDTGKTLGVLVRKHNYLGPAWYIREVDLPAKFADRQWLLTLERVMWQSRVFVDGREIGQPQDSLCTPHFHRLGQLTPGKHHLAIRVDNRMIHPIGNKCHSYGEQTQSRWNGIVGKIELTALVATAIDSLRIFTPALDRAEIEVTLTGPLAGIQIRASLIDRASGLPIGSREIAATAATTQISIVPQTPVMAWSEFSPKTYYAKVELLRDGQPCVARETTFGFRTIGHVGNKLLINGQPAFMRGNVDNIHFPRTGYPSTRKADWIAIFKKYQEHHLNHVRFHSWCPPEAAFAAADELGIYIHAEGPIWIDWWMTRPNSRLEMDTEGYPQGLGKNDRSIDAFARAEFRRILDAYGNHPSFCFFTFGNELGTSDFSVTGQWIGELKQYDPRHLYAASTARTITPNCDYSATHNIPGIGHCRQHYEFGTAWDYEKQYAAAPVPIIAHEVGQWPVYPDWAVCEKFTGTLRNTRLEKMRDESKANGVYDDQPDLTRASGALNQRLYKDEIESFLRTPDCRGFQLLSMQDFQGQGEAYVGWLDCFWDSKGTTDPRAFRGYCAPVVALAKLPQYVFTDGDTLACDLLVRNDGPCDLKNARLTAKLVNHSGAVLAKSGFTATVAKGQVVIIGKAQFPLVAQSASRLNLVLELEGKDESNSYPLWVYPKSLSEIRASNLLVAHEFGRETEAALAAGKSVLMIANRLGDDRTMSCADWMPVYWSTVFFPGEGPETLGLVVRNAHPALADFPTEGFNDWQWNRLCIGARGFDLTGLVPEGFKPIAQPVTDFHLNRKLGSLFECKAGNGKLLVCGYDLDAQYPETKQLRFSLMRYAESAAFQPTQQLSTDTLRTLLRAASKKIVFVAGTPSHGYAQHEHYPGCLLLAKALEENVRGVSTVVCRDGWPKDAHVLDNAAAIVIFADGGPNHPIMKHLEEVDRLMQKRVGLACLHYAVEVPKGPTADRLLKWIGGCYETFWSVNPHWRAEFKSFPDHPVARGVKPFSIEDEWYFHMRFPEQMKGVTPILTAIPPDDAHRPGNDPHGANPVVFARKGMPEHMAWVIQRPDGGRGFGFTGGHFHWNWANDNFRTLVLNGIVWTAGLDVPAGGIASKTPTLDQLEANFEKPKPPDYDRAKIQKMLDSWKAPAGMTR